MCFVCKSCSGIHALHISLHDPLHAVFLSPGMHLVLFVAGLVIAKRDVEACLGYADAGSVCAVYNHDQGIRVPVVCCPGGPQVCLPTQVPHLFWPHTRVSDPASAKYRAPVVSDSLLPIPLAKLIPRISPSCLESAICLEGTPPKMSTTDGAVRRPGSLPRTASFCTVSVPRCCRL